MIYIEWMDSMVSTSGWAFNEDIRTDSMLTCKTVGFVFYEDSEQILLCGDYLNDPARKESQNNRRITIPKRCITYMQDITLRIT